MGEAGQAFVRAPVRVLQVNNWADLLVERAASPIVRGLQRWPEVKGSPPRNCM
jgi:hypothetical protein